MRRLRKRQRVDTLKSESRPRKRGRLGRVFYLTLLAALFVALFDFLVGGLFYLRAQGMISQDVSIVAPEYPGSVVEIAVEEGDQVAEGQLVARLRSQRVLNDIADHAAELADAQSRHSEMRIRARQLDTLIPAAMERADALEDDRRRLQGLKQSGLITNTRQAKAIDEAYEALEDLKRLEAEADLVAAELAQVSETLERARTALEELETLYNRGWLVAPASGIVGTIAEAEGGGLKEGQTFMEIFHGRTYVLAFVPIGTLYTVVPGDKVSVRYGLRTMAGTVSALLPLASRLPQEFQQSFQTVRREQLVRIALPPGTPTPPLFTKVDIGGEWSPAALAADGVYRVSGLVRDAAVVVAAYGGDWLREGTAATARWLGAAAREISAAVDAVISEAWAVVDGWLGDEAPAEAPPPAPEGATEP